MKKFSIPFYICLIAFVGIAMVFMYPKQVSASDLQLEELDVDFSSNYSQSILLTQYLYTHTPQIGETIDVDKYYDLNTNVGKYKVIDEISNKTGLNAFVVESQQGNLILSIRGTEAEKLDGDLTTDAQLVINRNKQYESLRKYLTVQSYTGKLDYVTGHSLGGSIGLNIVMWLNDIGVDLKGAYIYSPALVVDDQYVSDKKIEAVTDIVHLVVLNNEILHNVGNPVISKFKALNPYEYFDYKLITIDGDTDNSIQNHFLDKLIPVLKGEKTAKYGNVQLSVENIEN